MNKLKKLIEVGLYALVFILPWQTRWIIKAGQINGGVNEYLTYSLYASDVLLIVLLLFSLVLSLRAKRGNLRLIKSKIVSSDNVIFDQPEIATSHSLLAMTKDRSLKLFVRVFVLTSFVSIFFASDKLLSFFIFARLSFGLGLVYLIIKATDKFKLIWWLVLGLVLPSWLAVWQFLSQSTFANKWLGLALHNPSEAGVSVIELGQIGQLPERWLRAYGSFDHPNILGGALAVGLLLTVFLLVSWSGETKAARLRPLLYLILSSLAAGCFVSFSRGAWLGLIFGLLTGTIVLIWKKNWAELKTWLLGASVIAAVFLVLLLPYHGLVGMRLGGEGRLEVKSNTERLASYADGWQLTKKHWLFGSGIGNYVLTSYLADQSQPSYAYQPTHNTWLLIGAETGLVGLLMLVGFFIMIVVSGFKNKSYFSLAILVAMSSMLEVDHWWWSLHFGIMFSLLALTLVVNFASNTRQ